jgi:tetratricopeptide (TPR) repeat protein
MRIINFKILTLIFTSFFSWLVQSSILIVQNNNTHLRMNIQVDRNQLSVEKRGEKILLKTLNQKIYEQISSQLDSNSLNKDYISSIKTYTDEVGRVPTIELVLTSPRVELFSFYREREKKYVLDFWTDNAKEPLVSQVQEKASGPAPIEKDKPRAKVKKDSVSSQASSPKIISPQASPIASEAKSQLMERDFRYGAAFIWDYTAIIPSLKRPIDLTRKTAEVFYPIKDLDNPTTDEQKHLQLSINLFNDSKWGLMAKSIQLFEQKFPGSSLALNNEYLKANTILRENFEKGDLKPHQTAIILYENILSKSENYEQRSALYRYLISYYLVEQNYLSALNYAKKFYTDSRENFDYEESSFAVEVLLFSLAKLQNITQIREVTQDKTLQKIIPGQLILAFELYALLSLNEEDEVIKLFEQNEKGLARPIEATILYNAAEAYFRTAQYEKAITLFDDFVAAHSYKSESSHARLRIALSYDLLDRDFNQTTELYRNAINRSVNQTISYEARIRYTAMKSVRPKTITKDDKEIRIFLERDRRIGDEVSLELRELLWLVRLRTFIVDEEYEKALAYLNAVPLHTLSAAKKRVFEGDGAEIVYGLMKTYFQNGEFAKVIQHWDIYKDRYIDKVAQDPFVNYLVGKAYIKLGLYSGFDNLYEKFVEMAEVQKRTYPLWVKRDFSINQKVAVQELKIIRHIALENWSAAKQELDGLSKVDPSSPRIKFYSGIIAYNEKNYQLAANEFERYLTELTGPLSFDPDDVANMMMSYTDSLFRLGDQKRFQRVARAILNDTRSFSPNHNYLKEVRERVAYLLIENDAKEMTPAISLNLEAQILDFMKNYPDSQYSGRISLILGMTFINNGKTEKGQELFEKLVNDEKASEMIKEMARSELSLLRIKNINL